MTLCAIFSTFATFQTLQLTDSKKGDWVRLPPPPPNPRFLLLVFANLKISMNGTVHLIALHAFSIDYSLRSATIGSTLAARRAGIRDAKTAVKASSSVADVSMIGSHGLTPNS
jgi:hypothetical protein